MSEDRLTLEIFLAARDLVNRGKIFKSDPFATVHYKLEDRMEEHILHTETIIGNLDPSWEQSFQIPYYPDSLQQLRITIYDSKMVGNGIFHNIQDLMGECTVMVKHIIQAKNELYTTTLRRKEKQTGNIYIKALKLHEPNHIMNFEFVGINLRNTDGIFGLSDPFLKLKRISEDVLLVVHKTEIIDENLNPQWKPFDICLHRLCKNDPKQKFRIECWDKHDNGNNNQLLGSLETTLEELTTKQVFDLIYKNKSAGTLRLVSFKETYKPNFEDYLNEGLKFQQLLAIDYSGENGNPQFPDSNHTINLSQENKYSKAIHDFSTAIQGYIKQAAVYGLCAEPHLLNYYKQTQERFFPLTGEFTKPQIQGTEAILAVYNQTLPQIQVNGALYLHEFIQYSIEVASATKNKYTICVIITQGNFEDEELVKKDILNGILYNYIATKVPISFIFITLTKLEENSGLKKLIHLNPDRPMVTVISHETGQNFQIFKNELLDCIPRQVIKYKRL